MGSSPESGAAGSVYLSVVWSDDLRVSRARRGVYALRGGWCTILGLDLAVDEQVDADNDDVADQVADADAVEPGRVLEWDALRHLHHAEHDDEVCDLRIHDVLVWVERVGGKSG